jgi:hypothetical protein
MDTFGTDVLGHPEARAKCRSALFRPGFARIMVRPFCRPYLQFSRDGASEQARWFWDSLAC